VDGCIMSCPYAAVEMRVENCRNSIHDTNEYRFQTVRAIRLMKVL